MHAAEWIALLTPGITVAGAVCLAVVKLTRMTVAIEQLTKSMTSVVQKVDGHETRLLVLEGRVSGRHSRTN